MFPSLFSEAAVFDESSAAHIRADSGNNTCLSPLGSNTLYGSHKVYLVDNDRQYMRRHQLASHIGRQVLEAAVVAGSSICLWPADSTLLGMGTVCLVDKDL